MHRLSDYFGTVLLLMHWTIYTPEVSTGRIAAKTVCNDLVWKQHFHYYYARKLGSRALRAEYSY